MIVGTSAAVFTGGSADTGTISRTYGNGSPNTSDAETVATSDSATCDEKRANETADERDETDETGEPSVDFRVEPYEIVECGFTCREATSTITNTGAEDATNVRVTVNVYADDHLIWETEEALGQLEAGSTITRTERIDVSLGEALVIRDNDRRITIEMTISSDQRTVQLSRTRVV